MLLTPGSCTVPAPTPAMCPLSPRSTQPPQSLTTTPAPACCSSPHASEPRNHTVRLSKTPLVPKKAKLLPGAPEAPATTPALSSQPHTPSPCAPPLGSLPGRSASPCTPPQLGSLRQEEARPRQGHTCSGHRPSLPSSAQPLLSPLQPLGPCLGCALRPEHHPPPRAWTFPPPQSGCRSNSRLLPEALPSLTSINTCNHLVSSCLWPGTAGGGQGQRPPPSHCAMTWINAQRIVSTQPRGPRCPYIAAWLIISPISAHTHPAPQAAVGARAQTQLLPFTHRDARAHTRTSACKHTRQAHLDWLQHAPPPVPKCPPLLARSLAHHARATHGQAYLLMLPQDVTPTGA